MPLLICHRTQISNCATKDSYPGLQKEILTHETSASSKGDDKLLNTSQSLVKYTSGSTPLV